MSTTPSAPDAIRRSSLRSLIERCRSVTPTHSDLVRYGIIQPKEADIMKKATKQAQPAKAAVVLWSTAEKEFVSIVFEDGKAAYTPEFSAAAQFAKKNAEAVRKLLKEEVVEVDAAKALDYQAKHRAPVRREARKGWGVAPAPSQPAQPRPKLPPRTPAPTLKKRGAKQPKKPSAGPNFRAGSTKALAYAQFLKTPNDKAAVIKAGVAAGADEGTVASYYVKFLRLAEKGGD